VQYVSKEDALLCKAINALNEMLLGLQVLWTCVEDWSKQCRLECEKHLVVGECALVVCELGDLVLDVLDAVAHTDRQWTTLLQEAGKKEIHQ
jgi:environmental stress-induced protein Ves